MIESALSGPSHTSDLIEIFKDVALYAALLAAVIGGVFSLYSNKQKSQLDRELQLQIAQLGLMKSAFDVRFREEFETYKFLWPALQTLITTLKLETDGLIEKEGTERAEIIDRDLTPVAEKLYTITIFLPANIRDLAEIIVKNSASWRVNLMYPDLANPDIFTAPRKVEDLRQDLIRLRDMIANRIDQPP